MLAAKPVTVAWKPFTLSLLLAASGQPAAHLARDQGETREAAEVVCQVEGQSTIGSGLARCVSNWTDPGAPSETLEKPSLSACLESSLLGDKKSNSVSRLGANSSSRTDAYLGILGIEDCLGRLNPLFPNFRVTHGNPVYPRIQRQEQDPCGRRQ